MIACSCGWGKCCCRELNTPVLPSQRGVILIKQIHGSDKVHRAISRPKCSFSPHDCPQNPAFTGPCLAAILSRMKSSRTRSRSRERAAAAAVSARRVDGGSGSVVGQGGTAGDRRDKDEDKVTGGPGTSARNSNAMTGSIGDGFRLNLERAITTRMQEELQVHRCGGCFSQMARNVWECIGR